jgi:hypothetical protein
MLPLSQPASAAPSVLKPIQLSLFRNQTLTIFIQNSIKIYIFKLNLFGDINVSYFLYRIYLQDKHY